MKEMDKKSTVNKTKSGKSSGKGKSKGKSKKKVTVSERLIKYGLVAVMLFIFYMIFCGIVGKTKFYPNTTVNGIDVSRMTVSEASSAVSEEFEKKYDNINVSVSLNGEIYSIYITDAMNMDVTDAVQAALDDSHSFLTRGVRFIKALFVGQDYSASPVLKDEEKLKSAIVQSGITDISLVDDAAYEMSDTEITVIKGKGGYIVDEDKLVSDIIKAFEDDTYKSVLECPLIYSDVNLNAIYDEIKTEPADATLDAENNYEIIPSVDGISFDLEAAQSLLDAAADGEAVTIPLVFTKPDISTEDLRACLFRDVIGTFDTNVGGSKDRKSNVELAAEKCDDYILLPGDIFAFNDTVGQRTVANGFKAAPAYVNGDTVEEVGGGICQVSSTIYNAVLLANLEITERHNHSYLSSYVDPGYDATVSWGGPDFKFCNNTQYPIKLVMTYDSGVLTAEIYGTKTDDITVKMTSTVLAIDNYETVYEEDETMEVGEEKTSVVGETGYKVQTYRNLYDGNGNLISTTEEAYSNYKRRDKVVLVGTKDTEEETEEETSENPEGENLSTEVIVPEAPATETPGSETPATTETPVPEIPVTGENANQTPRTE